MRQRNKAASLAVAALAVAAMTALLGTASPAQGDWLVMHDGSRVETKGPWRVDGKRILFDLPNGTLSMIRADQVDLDRSATATAEARNAAVEAKPAAAPKKEPVLVLTEKDIPPSTPAPTEGDAKKEGAADASGSPLEVISWEKTETPDGSGVEIFGTIRNNSANMVVSPSVMITVYDADGDLLATSNGQVNSPQIAAGKTANFRVNFAGLLDFASAKFDAQGRGFKQRKEGEEGEEGEAVSEEESVPPST